MVPIQARTLHHVVFDPEIIQFERVRLHSHPFSAVLEPDADLMPFNPFNNAKAAIDIPALGVVFKQHDSRALFVDHRVQRQGCHLLFIHLPGNLRLRYDSFRP